MSPATPAKNGPCPCGSGRKYKRCCLPGAVERRGPRTLETRDLSKRLLDYIERDYPEHFREVLLALYGGPLPERHEQIAVPMAAFELLLPSGRTAAQELSSRGLELKLLGELADRSAAWLSTRTSARRCAAATPSFVGSTCTVATTCSTAFHPSLLGPRAADAIIGRIRPHIDRRRLRLEVSQVRTPSVALTLFHEWQTSTTAEADGSSRHEVELRNTDGEAFEPTTDIYAHPFADTRALTWLLCGLPGVFEFESDDPHLCLTRRRNTMHRGWMRTTLAELHVSAERLRVECNSQRRADHVRALLEQLADAQLRHLHRSVAPLVTKMVDVHAGPLAVDAQPVAAWLGAPSSEWVIADQLRRWQKQPHSSLDELPPQAAVKQAKLRREVPNRTNESSWQPFGWPP